MPTLLLSRSCRPEAERLAQVARQAKWNHQWIGLRRVPEQLHGTEFGLYAQTDVALGVARRHDLALIEPSFDILARFPERHVCRQMRFMPLTQAKTIREPVFVKPADCTHKCFDAAVYESGWHILCADDLDPMTPVLVSEPVEWAVEYRAIVLERRVVTFSPYIRGGWRACDTEGNWPYPAAEGAEAIAFCESIMADQTIDLPPVFTLDIGMIEGRGWAIVELNPVWCSGLLGCDLSRMLLPLLRACWRRELLPVGERKWVLARGHDK